jgi:hypothetical protein
VEKMLGALPVVAQFSRRLRIREMVDAACPMRGRRAAVEV